MDDYVPARRLRGGHRMTVYVWARRRRFPGLPPAEARLFRVSPDTQVLAHCHWQDDRQRRATLLAVHGLEGSSGSHYMRGMAHKAFRRGLNVVLLNQRNCGGTEALTPGLYHSGLIADPAAVIHELIEADGLPSIGLAGYSLGGNLVLKLVAEYGETAPAALRSACAVSPTLDLDACTRLIERRRNRMYEQYFLWCLKQRMKRKHRLFADRFPLDGLRRIRTIRAFDDRYTAPYHGFADAADYYHRASAVRVADRIRVPTLILSAEDDPFVPVAPLQTDPIALNPHVTVTVTPHGGHCGFVGRRSDGSDGYWAEERIVQFSLEHALLPHPLG